jgi:hypothetical protein
MCQQFEDQSYLNARNKADQANPPPNDFQTVPPRPCWIRPGYDGMVRRLAHQPCPSDAKCRSSESPRNTTVRSSLSPTPPTRPVPVCPLLPAPSLPAPEPKRLSIFTRSFPGAGGWQSVHMYCCCVPYHLSVHCLGLPRLYSSLSLALSLVVFAAPQMLTSLSCRLAEDFGCGWRHGDHCQLPISPYRSRSSQSAPTDAHPVSSLDLQLERQRDYQCWLLAGPRWHSAESWARLRLIERQGAAPS